MAARPVDLNQQGRERLVRRISRVHVQHVAAIGGLLGHEGKRPQKARVIQTAAGKRLAGRQARLQAGKVIRAGPDQVDLGIQGSVQGRFEVDITQAQRQRGCRKQQGQQQDRAKITLEHRISQRIWLLSNAYKTYS